MCYSAQVNSDYRKFVREFGAIASLKDFADLFFRRDAGENVKIPKALEAVFARPETDEEARIKALVEAHHENEATRLQQELFAQRKRLADADRKLQAKITKGAVESKRIASDKIERGMRRLGDLRRTELVDHDSRIYPGYYCPVLVVEDGRKVVKPMRYQCRPCGKPAFYDTKFPGTYNARRDNLEGFWKAQFAQTHGLIVVNAFYENVSRHRLEGRELGVDEKEQNVVLEFRPRPTQDMLVACLWSRWTGPDGAELLSFAAITDEPPPEVAAAGHDRCIIPIKRENVDAWLDPRGAAADAYAILDDRERPYYEHRKAA